MKYIFGLLMCLAIFAFTPSVGYATPTDTQTEKTFKIDIETPVIAVVSIEIESSKVAHSYEFVRIESPNFVRIGISPNAIYDIYKVAKDGNLNYNLFTNLHSEYIDLPIEVGWCSLRK